MKLSSASSTKPVVKALDYRPRGSRFQPHYSNRDFSPRSLLSSAQRSE